MTAIRISSQGKFQYEVLVTTSSCELVKALRNVVDKDMFGIPDFERVPYVDLSLMDFDQQQSLVIAAKLHYENYIDTTFHPPTIKNKINTIKFIRSLTSTAPLKQAKELVDYAIGGQRPDWLKIPPYKE